MKQFPSTNNVVHPEVQAIRWVQGRLELLDQRQLPQREEYLSIDTSSAAADAIRDMVVRGAPAIGVTAAYAVVLAVSARYSANAANWRDAVRADMAHLAVARPTAVNLKWALERMRGVIDSLSPERDPVAPVLAEARRIHDEDIAGNRRMGELGSALIAPGSNVLTHCNTGALATAGYGTALGVIRAGVASHRIDRVFADETRPWLQGSRLTAWELVREGVPVTLIPDSAAAYLMRRGEIQWVIVGADRIAGNGDVANKIGTYSLAVNARAHGVKFMVVAPLSTVDMGLKDGSAIPIEERDASEVLAFAGNAIAPAGTAARNPVFDITPAELVDFLVTEKGAVEKPDHEQLQALFDQK